MDALLEKLVEENRPFTREGRVAGYIPELAKADRDELGICVVSSDGRISSAGEYRRTFTIQSIIKPILLLLALMDNGEDTVRARVGVEATGKPFDAINYTDQALLSEHLNPMVNMGAILLCTLIHGTSYSQRLERLLGNCRSPYTGESEPLVSVEQLQHLDPGEVLLLHDRCRPMDGYLPDISEYDFGEEDFPPAEPPAKREDAPRIVVSADELLERTSVLDVNALKQRLQNSLHGKGGKP